MSHNAMSTPLASVVAKPREPSVSEATVYLVPDAVDVVRVLTDQTVGEILAHKVVLEQGVGLCDDDGTAAAHVGRFAVTSDAFVGVDLDEHPRSCFLGSDDVRAEVGDFHFGTLVGDSGRIAVCFE